MQYSRWVCAPGHSHFPCRDTSNMNSTIRTASFEIEAVRTASPENPPNNSTGHTKLPPPRGHVTFSLLHDAVTPHVCTVQQSYLGVAADILGPASLDSSSTMWSSSAYIASNSSFFSITVCSTSAISSSFACMRLFTRLRSP